MRACKHKAREAAEGGARGGTPGAIIGEENVFPGQGGECGWCC